MPEPEALCAAAGVRPVHAQLVEERGSVVLAVLPGQEIRWIVHPARTRTGISDAELRVAFEVDEIDMAAREGWSVLIQGPAHHVDDPAERASVLRTGIEPWPGGEREHFSRITPMRITGRRIRHAG